MSYSCMKNFQPRLGDLAGMVHMQLERYCCRLSASAFSGLVPPSP
jgi:hypothetical protein